jgi:cell division protein FtsI/penicillin-binding protein 2
LDSKRRRIVLSSAALVVWTFSLATALFYLQVVRGSELRARARRQHEQVLDDPAQRGLILDRTGRVLAISVTAQSLYAHPDRVDHPELVASLLAPILGESESDLLARLRSDAAFVWLGRRLDVDVVKAVEASGVLAKNHKALGFMDEPKRYYPEGLLATHVVGTTDADGNGIEGIEKSWDEDLRGTTGKILVARDGRGNPVQRRVLTAAKPGRDVLLTIDAVLQQTVERELERACEESGAKSASVVILDPATGEILALANRPATEPRRFGNADPESRRNRSIADVFEPGSSFNVITVAAAIDGGTVSPDQRFECQSFTFAGKTYSDIQRYGLLSVREILEKSSNVGIAQISRTLPREALRDYIVRFGFGRKTGIELPGERNGDITSLPRMSAMSPISMAMGYEISVTALQMVGAVATLANGGVSVPGRIVLGTRDYRGTITSLPPVEPRRVISNTTAHSLCELLEGVVLHGTGSQAAVFGYRVAGKTGTAKKVVPGGWGYSNTDFVSSFVGFAPFDNPRLAAIVVLDTPRLGRYYGGLVAAPVFSGIMQQALSIRYRVPQDPELLRDSMKQSAAP